MRIYIILISGILLFASCTSQKRATYNYLEEIKDTSFKKSVYMAEPIIQKSDLLSIQVYSMSINAEVDKLYNLPVINNGGMQGSNQQQGILVDQHGNINYPRLGI